MCIRDRALLALAREEDEYQEPPIVGHAHEAHWAVLRPGNGPLPGAPHRRRRDGATPRDHP
eukprot:6883725-Alexandrium_andersonii.AAC.1